MEIKEITEKEAQKLADRIYKIQSGVIGFYNMTTEKISEIKSGDDSEASASESKDSGWLETQKQSIQEYADSFAEYGLSVSFTDTDYQFYYNEEPVCFVADNKAVDGGFSGSVYFNADNGSKGVVTIRDGSDVIGMKLLSEEETKRYNSTYW